MKLIFLRHGNDATNSSLSLFEENKLEAIAKNIKALTGVGAKHRVFSSYDPKAVCVTSALKSYLDSISTYSIDLIPKAGEDCSQGSINAINSFFDLTLANDPVIMVGGRDLATSYLNPAFKHFFGRNEIIKEPLENEGVYLCEQGKFMLPRRYDC